MGNSKASNHATRNTAGALRSSDVDRQIEILRHYRDVSELAKWLVEEWSRSKQIPEFAGETLEQFVVRTFIIDTTLEDVLKSAPSKGRRLLARLKKDFRNKELRSLDAETVVQGLSDELAEFITPKRIEALRNAIQIAKDHPPEDKQGFVRAVNYLLDVFQLRIRGDDGELYRLRVLPGRKAGHEYLALRGGGGADSRTRALPEKITLTSIPTPVSIFSPANK